MYFINESSKIPMVTTAGTDVSSNSQDAKVGSDLVNLKPLLQDNTLKPLDALVSDHKLEMSPELILPELSLAKARQALSEEPTHVVPLKFKIIDEEVGETLSKLKLHSIILESATDDQAAQALKKLMFIKAETLLVQIQTAISTGQKIEAYRLLMKWFEEQIKITIDKEQALIWLTSWVETKINLANATEQFDEAKNISATFGFRLVDSESGDIPKAELGSKATEQQACADLIAQIQAAPKSAEEKNEFTQEHLDFINQVDHESRSALMLAAKRGFESCVAILLSNGAKREQTDKDGKTAAFYLPQKKILDDADEADLFLDDDVTDTETFAPQNRTTWDEQKELHKNQETTICFNKRGCEQLLGITKPDVSYPASLDVSAASSRIASRAATRRGTTVKHSGAISSLAHGKDVGKSMLPPRAYSLFQPRHRTSKEPDKTSVSSPRDSFTSDYGHLSSVGEGSILNLFAVSKTLLQLQKSRLITEGDIDTRASFASMPDLSPSESNFHSYRGSFTNGSESPALEDFEALDAYLQPKISIMF